MSAFTVQIYEGVVQTFLETRSCDSNYGSFRSLGAGHFQSPLLLQSLCPEIRRGIHKNFGTDIFMSTTEIVALIPSLVPAYLVMGDIARTWHRQTGTTRVKEDVSLAVLRYATDGRDL
jgi:hypothetical protein